MRIAVVVALVALAVAACSTESDVSGRRFVEISDSDSADEESIYNEVPYGPGVEVGQVYDYELYVHCGVNWTRIDGALWAADPPDDGSGNPPDGWGNPYDSGTLVLIDKSNAEYRGGPDAAVRFVRTDLTEAPVSCR